MATSVIPALIDALIAQAQTALGDAIAVHDGYGVSGNVADNLMVGVEDPFSDQAAPSADSQQSWQGIGPNAPRDEVGDITCVAYATSGGKDQSVVRTAVFAITAAVENLLRASPDLGLGPSVRPLGFGSDLKFMQDQDADGVWALVVFSIHFEARI